MNSECTNTNVCGIRIASQVSNRLQQSGESSAIRKLVLFDYSGGEKSAMKYGRNGAFHSEAPRDNLNLPAILEER